ncbi:MAG: ATP-dependent helicase [Thermoplasmata archaeon]|nr:MAG: ATP-dependent helicase [Thermoplasmata archaeon]
MGIYFIKEPWSDEENLACLESHVREWFTSKFEYLTPPQRFSFKLISRNSNVLITAPTGSGKTFSAFMVILSDLFKLSKQKKLEDGVYCVYVSPLRALNNDIYKNLVLPLHEIKELYGDEVGEVRVGIRTGDISSYEKQKQLRKPPHILITTPESLAIILNSRRFVEKLKTTRWIIIDEIHELASNKRGVHLSLSIERLQEIVGRDFIRIGLGATLYPLEEAAKFLVGFKNGKLRSCRVVDVSWFKPFDLKLICPTSDIIYTDADEMNAMMYEQLDKIIAEHNTTLVFTNTRSGTERVVHYLKNTGVYKEEEIAAHHGSLSRETRWDVEDKLKKGLLKAVISSTSLELGIDIGYIDVVVQIGSPKSVTRCVQRVGRSGHGLNDTAKGIIIGMDRDDIVECGVMLKCALERNLDKIRVPQNCLDVLIQHIVGMGLNKKWSVDEAYKLVKNSYCYHNLSYDIFIQVLHYVAGHYASLEDRSIYGKIWFDEKDGMFGRRGRYTKVIYYLNIGTIPDEVKVDVYTVDKKRYVGSIEEEFLERLRKKDVFVLGGKTYMFRYARGMRCYVEEKKEETPTIPAWFSELLPLSYELAGEIRSFREQMLNLLKKNDREGIRKLLSTLPIDNRSKKAIEQYFKAQYNYLKKIPTYNHIIIEETRDLKNRNLIVFHTLYGRRVNDALSRVFAILIGRTTRSDVLTTISDNGFSLILPKDIKADVEKTIEELYTVDIVELLKNNIRRTELMKRRFRHTAARSFLVLRNYKGYKISVRKQQVNSQGLLRVCEMIDKDFPIIQETYREILEDIMDIEKTQKLIADMKKGRVTWEITSTPVPSPFAHNLIVLGEADIVLMKDRRQRLIELHEAIMERRYGR